MRRRLEMQIACHSERTWAYYMIMMQVTLISLLDKRNKTSIRA